MCWAFSLDMHISWQHEKHLGGSVPSTSRWVGWLFFWFSLCEGKLPASVDISRHEPLLIVAKLVNTIHHIRHSVMWWYGRQLPTLCTPLKCLGEALLLQRRGLKVWDGWGGGIAFLKMTLWQKMYFADLSFYSSDNGTILAAVTWLALLFRLPVAGIEQILIERARISPRPEVMV